MRVVYIVYIGKLASVLEGLRNYYRSNRPRRADYGEGYQIWVVVEGREIDRVGDEDRHAPQEVHLAPVPPPRAKGKS